MKRIFFCLAGLLTVFGFTTASAAPNFQEGVEYIKIVPAQPTADKNKVEVVELFWYGCPHCHRFQPYVEKWLQTKPANVEYIRMPAILRESWALGARAFYTAKILGKLTQIHEPLFNAIHNERRRMNTEEDMSKFFAEHGVSPDEFHKTFHSFAVDTQVRRARVMTRRYHTMGTPTVVINGKYRTDPGAAKGFEKMIQVIDFLVAKESRPQS